LICACYIRCLIVNPASLRLAEKMLMLTIYVFNDHANIRSDLLHRLICLDVMLLAYTLQIVPTIYLELRYALAF
jgi:hypothetical protein